MSLKHAVLGFLSIAPMTGYDLRKHMEESVAHFWPADQAQIYRTLGHLAADGLVTVTTIPQEGKPDRREHSITDAGLAELDRWLASPVEYVPSREVFLVRLFFVGRLGDLTGCGPSCRNGPTRLVSWRPSWSRPGTRVSTPSPPPGSSPPSTSASGSPLSPTGWRTRAPSSSGRRT